MEPFGQPSRTIDMSGGGAPVSRAAALAQARKKRAAREARRRQDSAAASFQACWRGSHIRTELSTLAARRLDAMLAQTQKLQQAIEARGGMLKMPDAAGDKLLKIATSAVPQLQAGQLHSLQTLLQAQQHLIARPGAVPLVEAVAAHWGLAHLQGGELHRDESAQQHALVELLACMLALWDSQGVPASSLSDSAVVPFLCQVLAVPYRSPDSLRAAWAQLLTQGLQLALEFTGEHRAWLLGLYWPDCMALVDDLPGVAIAHWQQWCSIPAAAAAAAVAAGDVTAAQALITVPRRIIARLQRQLPELARVALVANVLDCAVVAIERGASAQVYLSMAPDLLQDVNLGAAQPTFLAHHTARGGANTDADERDDITAAAADEEDEYELLPALWDPASALLAGCAAQRYAAAQLASREHGDQQNVLSSQSRIVTRLLAQEHLALLTMQPLACAAPMLHQLLSGAQAAAFSSPECIELAHTLRALTPAARLDRAARLVPGPLLALCRAVCSSAGPGTPALARWAMDWTESMQGLAPADPLPEQLLQQAHVVCAAARHALIVQDDDKVLAGGILPLEHMHHFIAALSSLLYRCLWQQLASVPLASAPPAQQFAVVNAVAVFRALQQRSDRLRGELATDDAWLWPGLPSNVVTGDVLLGFAAADVGVPEPELDPLASLPASLLIPTRAARSLLVDLSSSQPPVASRPAGGAASWVHPAWTSHTCGAASAASSSATTTVSRGPSLPAAALSEARTRAVMSAVPFVVPFQQRASAFSAAVRVARERMQAHQLGMADASTQLTVHRAHFLGSACRALLTQLRPGTGGVRRLRGRTAVSFIDVHNAPEAGIDGGGLFREFFEEFTSLLFHPDTGLWKVAPGEQALHPTPAFVAWDTGTQRQCLDLYALAGAMLGKAVWEGMTVAPRLAKFFLTKLLDQHNTLDDLARVDLAVYRSLLALKSVPREAVDDMGLTFEVSITVPAGKPAVLRQIDAAPTQEELHARAPVHAAASSSQDGSGLLEAAEPEEQVVSVPLRPHAPPVTADTLHEYLSAVATWRLNSSIARQTDAFLHGWRSIVPQRWLLLFTASEADTLLCGVGDGALDVRDLSSSCQYAGGYHAEHPTIQALWRVVARMEPSDRAAFMAFITSTPRQPLLGWASLVPRVGVARVPIPEGTPVKAMQLPTAGTCMHLLKLPDYGSEDVLEAKLLAAVRAGKGFMLS